MDINEELLATLRQRPAEWLKGTVRIDPIIQAKHPARVAGARVTFEPPQWLRDTEPGATLIDVCEVRIDAMIRNSHAA